MTAVTAHSGAGEQAVPGAQVPMPRGRRSTELLMLVFAVGVVLAAYASAGLGLNGELPAGLVEYGVAFAALVFGAHLAVRRLAPWADPLMLPLAALLNGLGIVMIYRLQESGRGGNPGSRISTMTASTTAYQVVWSAVGIAAFIVVLAVIREPRVLQRYTYTFGALGLVLLAAPALLPASISSVNGAKVWIIIGGFSIQPGEFAKLALAVFFAGYLVAKRDVLALAGRRVLGIDLPRARDLGPVLIAWAASLLILVFESDIGTSALFFGLFVAMIYVATQRTSWLLIGIALFAFGTFVASKLFSHVDARFTAWLDPFSQANVFCNPAVQAHCVSSYQLVQGLYGMGFGGILGTGLGHGEPFFTPLAQSDFIITAFGEELGLTGLMAILLIFGLIVQRGLRAAVQVRDPFAKLLAGGFSFVLALQVFVIVGGVTGLIPLTGVTTPFLSQGGSSLVASWAMIGLLMRVSDTARRPAPQPIQDEGMTQIVRAG
jgi:cell division protein FtsW (lipid II flippase)